MGKVVRLSDETVRLLEIYRNQIIENFKKNNMTCFDDILKKDCIILDSALRLAIECDAYLGIK